MSKIDDIADPELIARIVDWFGEPAAPPRAPSEAEAVDPDVAEYYANIARACEAVTPEMLAYAERHTSVGERFATREIPELTPADIACYSPDRAPRVGIAEPRQYDRPDWIKNALSEENTPQAVLRDLHRPVVDFSNIAMERTEFHGDITGERRARDIQALMACRFQIDITEFSLSWKASQEALADRDEILDAPWENSKPKKPMPKPSLFGPSAENAYWFGD